MSNQQLQNLGPEKSQGPDSTAELPPNLQVGLGLAVACFVLGLVSLPLSLFVIGGALGLVGLILAIIHLKKVLPFKAIALWGLVLSAAGLLSGAGFGIFYGVSIYSSYKMMEQWGDIQFEEYIGTATPDMTLTDIEGNEITLSEFKGKRVILDFWATWCPPCIKEIPHFVKLRETTEPNEIVIIGISSEPAEKIKDFAEKQSINYPLVSISDDELPEPYSDIASIPTTFFIDQNGIIENVLSGYHSFEVLKDNALGCYKEPEEPKTDRSSED